MRGFLRDLGLGVRMLARQPAWTGAAVFCLGLSAAGSTIGYSIVSALLLRPLPFDKPHELVMVALQEQGEAEPHPFSLPDYRSVAARQRTFADLSAWTFREVSLAGGAGAEVVEAQIVGENYFRALHVAPLAGRFFGPEDATGAPVAVLSERLWRSRYASDRQIVGATIRISGRLITVAGVAPAGFVGAMGLVTSDVWLPAALYHDVTGAGNDSLTPTFGVFGRLAPGTTAAAARAELESIVRAIWIGRGASAAPAVIVEPATGFGVPAGARRTMTRAATAVALIIALLIGVAAANVASLVLARTAERSREVAVRLALGATRWHVIRHLLAENLLLALAGGAIGVFLTAVLSRGVASVSQVNEYLSYAVDFTPDLRVVVFALATSAATGAVCAIAPARLAARTDLATVVGRTSANRGSSGAGRFAPLIVGQIAISTALLVMTGLLSRTYLSAEGVDPGIETHGIVETTVNVAHAQLGEDAGRRLFTRVLASAAQLPGVQAVALSREAPLASDGVGRAITAGTAADAAGELVVTSGFFDLLGIPIVGGRAFTDLDGAGPAVAVVNETMARKLWAGLSPLGRTFRSGADTVLVIGVAKDVKYRSLVERAQPVYYRPFPQVYSAQMTVLVKSATAAGAMKASLRRLIAALDADIAPIGLKTLDEQREAGNASRRTVAALLAVLAGLGLLLAAVGLSGVIAYAARRRVREFGIRMALGAAPGDVLRLVFAQGAALVGIGLGGGILLAAGLGRAASAMLFGVTPLDPLTTTAVCAVVVLAAAVALYVPARWATLIDPAITLRSE